MSDDDLRRDLAALRGGDAPDDLVARSLVDAALTAARREAPVPSEMLMARIARDARKVATARRRTDRLTWGGLIAACAVGLAVGLTGVTGLLTDSTTDTVEAFGGGYEFQFAGLDG